MLIKFIFFIVGFIFFNPISAQDTLKLIVDNPEPRIGDKVELSFSVNFFTDDLKNQLNDDIEMTNSFSVFGDSNDKFIRVIEFMNKKKYTVGPFKFDFNGKAILTDSIIIDVVEKLPFKEGVWIRYISDNNENKFLVVEQLIKNELNYSEDKDELSFTITNKIDDKTEFVEIEEISENGIKVNLKQTKNNIRTKDSNDIFAPGLSFSFKKYQVELNESYDGTFKLKKKHLKNFPKKTSFTEIIITK